MTSDGKLIDQEIIFLDEPEEEKEQKRTAIIDRFCLLVKKLKQAKAC